MEILTDPTFLSDSVDTETNLHVKSKLLDILYEIVSLYDVQH